MLLISPSLSLSLSLCVIFFSSLIRVSILNLPTKHTTPQDLTLNTPNTFHIPLRLNSPIPISKLRSNPPLLFHIPISIFIPNSQSTCSLHSKPQAQKPNPLVLSDASPPRFHPASLRRENSSLGRVSKYGHRSCGGDLHSFHFIYCPSSQL